MSPHSLSPRSYPPRSLGTARVSWLVTRPQQLAVRLIRQIMLPHQLFKCLIYFSDWSVLVGPFITVVVSHIFAMASGSRCFHTSRSIGSARGLLFLAEYAPTFFSVSAIYFTFWPVFRRWVSAKWDLSIENATFKKNFQPSSFGKNFRKGANLAVDA